ncbi:MAG: hypothetical protein IPG45_16390 [Deltaproteobacteria bacterium]|jgi:hypothetical protein|nr:hypothetical protein [Deltaproteobacteria bacterium]
MGTSNNIHLKFQIGRITQRVLSTLFCGALAVTLSACGGTEGDDLEEVAVPVETTEQGLRITCRQASLQYDAICHQYGNTSSQCSTAYDVLHCFCQNCVE